MQKFLGVACHSQIPENIPEASTKQHDNNLWYLCLLLSNVLPTTHTVKQVLNSSE